jgi:glutathione synthase/RimK-type ligase-like ATP-grasp enzyme
MLRRGSGWKTNAAQGASGEPVELDERLAELAVRAAQVVGAEHAGVDILPCDDGRYSVIEVNTIPGWRALSAATGVDAAQCVVDHVVGGAA